jgi:hypothetical protein
MAGYVMVRPDPYMAVSAETGAFEIANLPVGEHTFQLWHESLGYVTTISADSKTRSGKKGVHTFDVKPGDNDLGTLAVDAKDYAKQLSRSK